MADINDYIGNCKFDFTEREKSLMDIFAGSWEHCHNSSCMDCEFNNGNDKFGILLCMSYQYAKKLIDNGYEKVMHGEWKQCFEDWRKQIDGDECSACGFQHYGTSITHYHYCPNCGARMDGDTE